MYCPVVNMSPDLSLDMNGKQRAKAPLCLQKYCTLQYQCKSRANGCEQYRKPTLFHADLSHN